MLEMRVPMLREGFSKGREEPERCGCIVRLSGGEVEAEFFYISIKNNGVTILTINLFLIKSEEFFTSRSSDVRLYTSVIYDVPKIT